MKMVYVVLNSAELSDFNSNNLRLYQLKKDTYIREVYDTNQAAESVATRKNKLAEQQNINEKWVVEPLNISCIYIYEIACLLNRKFIIFPPLICRENAGSIFSGIMMPDFLNRDCVNFGDLYYKPFDISQIAQ